MKMVSSLSTHGIEKQNPLCVHEPLCREAPPSCAASPADVAHIARPPGLPRWLAPGLGDDGSAGRGPAVPGVSAKCCPGRFRGGPVSPEPDAVGRGDPGLLPAPPASRPGPSPTSLAWVQRGGRTAAAPGPKLTPNVGPACF